MTMMATEGPPAADNRADAIVRRTDPAVTAPGRPRGLPTSERHIMLNTREREALTGDLADLVATVTNAATLVADSERELGKLTADRPKIRTYYETVIAGEEAKVDKRHERLTMNLPEFKKEATTLARKYAKRIAALRSQLADDDTAKAAAQERRRAERDAGII